MKKFQNQIKMNKYNIDYIIGFSLLRPDYSISLPAFMNLVQETSLMATYPKAQFLNQYNNCNFAWFITNWQVEINYFPKVSEKINIATWPIGFKSFFGERGFEAKNDSGHSILRANSNWILLNLDNLKPFRINNSIAQIYGECFPYPIEKDFFMPKIIDFDPVAEYSYKVMKRDIDTNRHVNNANYLYWIYNYIPDDLEYDFLPKLLKVAYKKEIFLNDDVIIKIYRKNNDILAIIEKNGIIATEIYIEHHHKLI